MKPELIIQDMGGVHNKDMAGTHARLLKGGSFKKQRVVCIVPAISPIPPKVYLSHVNLAYPPNNGVVRIMAEGMEVGDAYSSAIEMVLAHPELSKYEYILTLEADNMPPAWGVCRLIEHMEEHPEFSCIGGLYYTKGYGGQPQIWGDAKDPMMNFRPQLPDIDGGLVECCGTGMGFNLWRMKMFKDDRLRKPWFKTLTGVEGQGIATQDLYAWGNFRTHGHRCAIACDVKVGHYDFSGSYGPPDTVW